MVNLILANEPNFVGKLIYNSLYGWVKTWGAEMELMGAFAITVILFTISLKLLTLPLDVWQKQLGRKNAKKMDVMKPELDRITKQCGDNRELLMQKQRVLYKKHKYSAFSACLPSLVTLGIFILIFSGFNGAVRWHNFKVYNELKTAYYTTYEDTFASEKDNGTIAEATDKAVAAAEKAVVATYKPEKFLLTKNIFMPDTQVQPIPKIGTFSGSGFGKLNIKEVNPSEYEVVMKPLMEKYNQTDEGKKQWNGYFILPLISFIMSILAAKLVKPPEQPQMAGQTEEQLKAQKSQAKMMTYMMPLMMGVFALFYSTAFTLYMVVNNIFSTSFNLIYNAITKKKDALEKEKLLSTTIKK